MEPFTYALVIAVCIVFSAFFSSSETALLRLRAHEIEQDVKAARGPAALAVRELVASTSRLLVTILLGNNVVNILAASAASALALHYMDERTGILVSASVMTVMILIFGEILPKALAAAHPRGIAYSVALPLYLLHQVLRPVHILLDRMIDPLVKRITGSVKGREVGSPEDLLRLAREARHRHPAGSPLAIIGAVAGAAEMTVEEIMVPRTEIVAFPKDISPGDLLEKILQERYTRVPIYEDSIDHILGVVHLKDLVKLVHDDGGDLTGILKPVLRIPARKPILRLLADMQRAFVHLALVKDEFGVTLGLITQEDILEEIVGEIRDEFDREELLTIQRMPDDCFQVHGRVKVLDFNRETGWHVPAKPGDTLSGLLFNTLGRSPHKGDNVRVGDYELVVVDLSGTRITHVCVRRHRAEDHVGKAEAPRSVV